jgi:transcription antitermination factor NusG
MNCSYNSTDAARPAIASAWRPDEPQKRWYAVQTRSNFEKRVAQELAGKGVENFLPAVAENRRWKDREKVIEMPLFRGYLFVQLADCLDSRWKVLRSSGVVRIVGRGQEAEPVPDSEIASIRQLLQSGTTFSVCPYLREGMRVRVRRGALEGVEGILLRAKNGSRLVISVDLLSRSVATEIDAENAEQMEEA